MLFSRKDKRNSKKPTRINSALDAAGPGPERDDTDGITIAITYPDRRYQDSKAAMPSDENVIEAKNWVDYNMK